MTAEIKSTTQDIALEYWVEFLTDSLDEHGIVATDEQIKRLAADALVISENQSMVFGPPPSGKSQDRVDLEAAQKALAEEREKVTCRLCRGTGRERIDGPSHYSVTDCWKCRGEGRHSP